MQQLVAQIQDLSARPGGALAQLHTALKAAESGLAQAVQQQGVDIIAQPLQALNAKQHTLGSIYLLCAIP